MDNTETARIAAQPTPVPDDIMIADHLIGGAIATAEAASVPIEHIVGATLRAFIHLSSATGATAAAAMHVYKPTIAPDVTTVKIALKVWTVSGNSGSITDTRWLVQQIAVRVP